MSGITPVAENLSSPSAHDIRKSGYCNSHLTDEEAEAQMMQITCLKSHSSNMEAKRGQASYLRSHSSQVEAQRGQAT